MCVFVSISVCACSKKQSSNICHVKFNKSIDRNFQMTDFSGNYSAIHHFSNYFINKPQLKMFQVIFYNAD